MCAVCSESSEPKELKKRAGLSLLERRDSHLRFPFFSIVLLQRNGAPRVVIQNKTLNFEPTAVSNETQKELNLHAYTSTFKKKLKRRKSKAASLCRRGPFLCLANSSSSCVLLLLSLRAQRNARRRLQNESCHSDRSSIEILLRNTPDSPIACFDFLCFIFPPRFVFSSLG